MSRKKKNRAQVAANQIRFNAPLTDHDQRRANLKKIKYKCRHCATVWESTWFEKRARCTACGGMSDPVKSLRLARSGRSHVSR